MSSRIVMRRKRNKAETNGREITQEQLEIKQIKKAADMTVSVAFL